MSVQRFDAASANRERPGGNAVQLKPLLLAIPVLLMSGAARAEIKSVKVPSANFREAPSTDANIMFSADRFYPVEIMKRENGWARVKDFEGDEAWVAERLLDDQEAVVISREKVNVREKGTTSSDIIFKAQRGEVFKVLGHEQSWLHIEDSNGEKGWIRDDMTWGESGKSEKAGEKLDKSEKDSKNNKKDDSSEGDKSDSKAKAADADKGSDCPKPKGDKKKKK
jgi:SH3-like domain-containing protein